MGAIQEISVELVLSPKGHLYLAEDGQVSERLRIDEAKKICDLFAENGSKGLLQLGIQDFPFPLPSSFLFWQAFARQFVTQVCKFSVDTSENSPLLIPEPDAAKLAEVVNCSLGIRGGEYLTQEVLSALWEGLAKSLHEELESSCCNVQEYLQRFNPRWNLVGKVCFHLAENKANEARPFAFLATYTTQLSQSAKPQHLPLQRVLQEYAGEKNNTALLALLLPVQKAAGQSILVKQLVDSGSVFQALSWTTQEAYRFLKEIPLMESSGIVLRLPNWWKAQSPPRAQVVVTIGAQQPSMLGLQTMLDFNVDLALDDGERLSKEEWETLLLNSSGNLVNLRGRWVEVDREKLQAVLAHWNKLRTTMSAGLSMSESLRLLAGTEHILTGQDSRNCVKTNTFSCLAAISSQISRKRINFPLNSSV